jgi:hypothetical protein
MVSLICLPLCSYAPKTSNHSHHSHSTKEREDEAFDLQLCLHSIFLTQDAEGCQAGAGVNEAGKLACQEYSRPKRRVTMTSGRGGDGMNNGIA